MRYQRAEHPLKLDGLAIAREFFAGCFAEFDAHRESL
jgi:DNA repair protein RadC